MAPQQVTIAAPNGRKIQLHIGLFINNEIVDSSSGQTISIINPATEQEIVSVTAALAEDVDRAVKAAPHQEDLATLEAMDNGKPYTQALGDVEETFSVFRYYAGWADKTYGQTIETGRHKFTYTLREPIGVCGQVILWNYPLAMAAWKLGPALATGNVSILKPAEKTSLSGLYLANLIIEAGFPQTGSAIGDHPGVDKIAFTGGKSPLLVYPDADLENAVKWTHYGTIYDEFLDLFVNFTNKTSVIGDPFDEKSWHGPQVSKAQYEKILAYSKPARDEGATIIAGGKTPDNRPNGKGYYIEPTIVGDVKPAMNVYREEIFGPFVVFVKFTNQHDALSWANDSEYGLGAAVFTSDVTRAIRVSEGLQSGQIWIKSSNNSDYRVPFGGVKQSGIGRELGSAGLEAYSTVKAVHLNLVMATPDS
ncbi:Aldehyde/histidinol dehydrogenase [Pyrenochaeta sp. MPI-SDFR-AT-0127]|nr:Aldehyde/histidinol dehydrogenase [Pyrenochaeta sp. MPI-SDFR-AT-0127]